MAGGKRLKMEMWKKEGEEGAGRPRTGSVRGVRLKDLHVHDYRPKLFIARGWGGCFLQTLA